ncbi:MAG TPA: hypothetical protein VFE58_11335 [Tepidisphaeraceae bacterium]|nr:hypothetical protein [Tepidisphaeraceae bacterium]
MKSNCLAAWRVIFVGCVFVLMGGERAYGEAEKASLPDGYFSVMSWDLPMWSSKDFASSDHGVGSLKDCGFNTVGFARPEHLAEVEKLGMKCILAPQAFPTAWRKMSDEEIFKAVKGLVEEGEKSSAVVGYFLADEPGEPDFAGLRKAVAAVKKLAPGKLAYINLFPNYATLGAADISQLGTATYEEYLEKYVSEVKPQFISYDNYQVQHSLDQANGGIAGSYYQNLMTVRKVAMEHGLPWWQIVASSQITPQITPPSPANLLLQAYTTMAAGAKGLTWYTYLSPGYLYAPIEKSGAHGVSWSYLKMVNEQVEVIGKMIEPMKSVGAYFSGAKPAGDLAGLPGKYVTGVECATPLMVGEFEGSGGEKCVMVVNLSLKESAKFKIAVKGGGEVKQVSPVDGSVGAMEGGDSLWLTAGQGVLLKLP